MKKGLVLEGGAMRGMFTAGVMDVLMENGIVFDGAIGVSAGAAFGCNYKSGQIGRVIRYNMRFCNDKRYSGISVFLKTGNIYSTDFCYGEVPLIHDKFDFDSYRKNPMEFYTVATNVETGESVYSIFDGDESKGFDMIRASASMPLVSQIVEYNGMKLLDGGIADSIPLKYFEESGYEKNVVVLTQPRDYVKKKNPLMWIIKRKYKKYPKFVNAVGMRHEMYNETLRYIEEREKSGDCLVIAPDSPLSVSKIEKKPEKLKECYDTGRKKAEALIEEIKEFLK